MASKQEIIADSLEKAGAGKRILDIGFAQEPNLFLRGDVYGIDIYPKNVSEYRETKRVDLNNQRVPYPGEFFDAIIIGCTLAHLANPLAALCETNRVLRPGGALIVSSPNPHYYWEIVLNVFYQFFSRRVTKSKKEEHFYSFSRFDMRTILGRAGFKVVGEKGYLFALVKTPLRFNPIRFPGMAYEIIYVAEKIGMPQEYTVYQEGGNAGGGLIRVPTKFS